MVCVLRPALALLLPPATKSMRDKSKRHLPCFIARLEKSTPDIKSMAQKKLRVPEHLSLFAHPLCYWMLVMPAGRRRSWARRRPNFITSALFTG
jgi:hypothetical protein